MLESAIANAENNHQLDVDRLVVIARRGRPVGGDEALPCARPRPSPRIEKWFSHLKIVVAEQHGDAGPSRRPHSMGHKVNPIGLRLGINRTWDSRWFAGADYAKLLHEDLKLRAHLRKKPVAAPASPAW